MPIAIEIDGANRHDMKLVEQTLCQLMIERPAPTHEKPQHLVWTKAMTMTPSAFWWTGSA
jgi:hypothetical protein